MQNRKDRGSGKKNNKQIKHMQNGTEMNGLAQTRQQNNITTSTANGTAPTLVPQDVSARQIQTSDLGALPRHLHGTNGNGASEGADGMVQDSSHRPLQSEGGNSNSSPRPVESDSSRRHPQNGASSRRLLPQEDEVEPWKEPVDLKALLDELLRLLNRFVLLPEWAAEALALWVVHTYAYELRDLTTYIGIESPEKRCGKTTLLTVLGELVNRPVVASNISSPAFFRVIEQLRPTLMIDEADTFLQGNDELRGILNSGYTRKTAFVWRVANQFPPPLRCFGAARQSSDFKLQNGERAKENQGNFNEARAVKFSCWCPKVMAAIGRLPETLADRCIVIRMQRRLAEEQVESLRDLDTGNLTRKCIRFVMDHAAEIRQARPGIPAGLNDRAADIWGPLLVLADLAGGEWPDKARQAAIGLTAGSDGNDLIGALLFDIFIIFAGAEGGRLFTRDLVGALNLRPDRPWSEMKTSRQPITDRWLAQKLSPYGIRPRNMWVNAKCAKGYEEEDFREAYRRYIPRADVETFRAQLKAMGKEKEGAGAA